MKATFDLPPELVRALKIRAVHQGKKLKDLAADLLRRGLEAPEPTMESEVPLARIETQLDGLPVVVCSPDAPATRMSLRDLLAMEQDAFDREDLQRSGHAL